MPSVQEVKAGLAEAAEEANKTTAQVRAAMDAADRTLTRLTAVAQGTQHPKIIEAIGMIQQCKQRLGEAAQLAQAAAQAARDYIGVLG